jgi:hypothetical protein
MSLSVKMSGEDVANLSTATGKNDTERCCHQWRLSSSEDAVRLNTSPFSPQLFRHTRQTNSPR